MIQHITKVVEFTLAVNAEKGQRVISRAFEESEGMGAMQLFGTQILAVALTAMVIYELYKHIVGRQSDFVTPIVKVGLAIGVLHLLPLIGNYASMGISFLSDKVFDAQLNALMADAWAATFKGVTDPGVLDTLEMLFDPISWLCLITFLILIGIVIIKMLIINVIWPVILGVAVFSGLIAIPIGTFPGMKSFKGWFVNVVEISIWPIVFQILICLLVGSFQGQLKEAKSLTEVRKIGEAQLLYYKYRNSGFGLVKTGLSDEKALALVKENTGYTIDAETIKDKKSMYVTFTRILALMIAYGLMCIATPILSRMIVRSESAAAMGSMIAGGAAAGATSALGWVGSRFGRVGAGIASHVAQSKIFTAMTGGKSKTDKMDKRKVGE